MVLIASVGIASGSWFGKKIKRYPLEAISAVDVRKALLTCELEIVMGGGVEAAKIFQGLMSRAENENIVMFPKGEYERVQGIARQILDAKQRRRELVAVHSSSESVAEKVRQLAAFRDEGLLSQAEFEAKKLELLRRL